MKKGSTNRNWTIGLDVSDKQSTYVVLDGKGQIVEEGKVATRRDALSKQFADGSCRMAIEAGCHSPWISRVLGELGHEVIVANPRQVALIAKNQRKTDRLDAMRLARLARMDPLLLSPITHRNQRSQEHLEVVRARQQLVQARTALINHVRAAVKSVGERLPACSAATFHRKVAAVLPQALRPALVPLLDAITRLTEEIKRLDTHVLYLIAEHYPAAQALLRQINGVGPLTALAFVVTIENPRRFSKSRDVGAYLGLTRRQRDSGDTAPQLHITKAGDVLVRRLLVQCAHYILGPFGTDCDLRRRGLKLAGSAGKKRAIVAVARKLGVLMHRLWVSGEVYEPLRHASVHPTAA
jgi:transposase